MEDIVREVVQREWALFEAETSMRVQLASAGDRAIQGSEINIGGIAAGVRATRHAYVCPTHICICQHTYMHAAHAYASMCARACVRGHVCAADPQRAHVAGWVGPFNQVSQQQLKLAAARTKLELASATLQKTRLRQEADVAAELASQRHEVSLLEEQLSAAEAAVQNTQQKAGELQQTNSQIERAAPGALGVCFRRVQMCTAQ